MESHPTLFTFEWSNISYRSFGQVEGAFSMTSWKLVEAIPEAVPAEVKSSNKVSHSGSFGQRGQGGRGRCTFRK